MMSAINCRASFAGLAAVLGLGVLPILSVAQSRPEAEPAPFRVCADPNNLPFSDAAGAGFENKIAQLVAADLGQEVATTWWAQRRGFVRNTLNAHLCDVVLGVPSHYDPVLTTRPYYRSTYVFVWRREHNLQLASLNDPRLRELSVGVHLIGNDRTNTPPAEALARLGIVNNVAGYPIYGDYREPDPPARLIEAVAHGKIDVAAAWGPHAGYAAKVSPVPLALHAIEDGEEFAPLRFAFDIAMGVRKGDATLKSKLDEIIARREPEIEALLREYGVPLLPVSAARDQIPAR
jgi:mxaJ protein